MYQQDDALENEMKKFAAICEAAALRKYGFSFSPLEIYMSGVDRQTGEPHANWRTRMSEHHPLFIHKKEASS